MAQIPFTSIRFDQASPTVFYVGKAVPWKVDSDQAWQIVRYTQSASWVISEFAEWGEYSYYSWNDRSWLTYK